jgi:hypothetical protein
MRNFSKSILNYFAAFNETRFLFGTKKLAFRWVDNEGHSFNVLDLAIFPEVQDRMLRCIAEHQPVSLSITRNEFAISISCELVAKRVLAHIRAEYGAAALEALLKDYGFYAEGNPLPAGQYPTSLFDIPVDKRNAWTEACRQYNLNLRKVFARGLLDVQQSKKDELCATLGLVNAFPRACLNARMEEQKFFNDLQLLSSGKMTADDYVSAVCHHLEQMHTDFILY